MHWVSLRINVGVPHRYQFLQIMKSANPWDLELTKCLLVASRRTYEDLLLCARHLRTLKSVGAKPVDKETHVSNSVHPLVVGWWGGKKKLASYHVVWELSEQSFPWNASAQPERAVKQLPWAVMQLPSAAKICKQKITVCISSPSGDLAVWLALCSRRWWKRSKNHWCDTDTS